MTNKQAPTKRQRDERARRIAMGIAVIQRPLKLIEKNSLRGDYPQARHAADRGDGALVKQIARRVS